MGLFDSSSTSTTSQSSTRNPWAPATPLLTGILGQANGALGNTGITGTENNALNTITNNSNAWSNQYAPQIGANATSLLNGGGALNQQGAVNQNYTNYQSAMNPLASNTNYDPMQTPGFADAIKTMMSDITNQTNGQFAAAGRDMSGMNTQTLGRGIMQGVAPTIAAQYNQNIQNQQGAANNLYSGGLQNNALLSGMQQQYLANQQEGANAAAQGLQASNTGANAAMAAEAARRGIPISALGLISQIGIPMGQLGGSAYGTSTTNTTNTPSIMSDIGQVGGLFSSGAGGTSAAQGALNAGSGLLSGLMAFSDRRLKEDITQIGIALDGKTKIYRYRYKGTPAWHLGFMADEIEKIAPDAVHEINGFKAVDYKLATDKVAEAA